MMRMRTTFGVAMLVVAGMVAVGRGQVPQGAAALVVRGGTVIDVRTGALQTNMAVVKFPPPS